MDEDDRITHITALIEASLLPKLVQDLGTDSLEFRHFDSFRKILDNQLMQLFDVLVQNEYLLFNAESTTLEFRCKFILLLCEQNAPGTLYQTRNHSLQNYLIYSVEHRLSKMLEDDPKLVDEVFKYYKQRLQKNCWKRLLGSLHGFDYFCTTYYGKFDNWLNRDLCTFILSVSMLLEEFYDPIYKSMCWRIMDVILQRTPEDVLRDLNIHNVIYETLIQNIPKVGTKDGTINIWKCLHKCMELTNVPDHSKWNKIDDLVLALIRRITFESNSEICIELFRILPMFCLLYTPDGLLLDNYSPNDDSVSYETTTQNLRDFCNNLDAPLSYRWAKKFLKLFLAESNRLQGNIKTALALLHVMHVCYLICITSIPAKVCEPHLLEFFAQFPAVLMEVVAVHRKDEKVVQCVREFLRTMLEHVQYQPLIPQNMRSNQTALTKLLEHDIFFRPRTIMEY